MKRALAVALVAITLVAYGCAGMGAESPCERNITLPHSNQDVRISNFSLCNLSQWSVMNGTDASGHVGYYYNGGASSGHGSEDIVITYSGADGAYAYHDFSSGGGGWSHWTVNITCGRSCPFLWNQHVETYNARDPNATRVDYTCWLNGTFTDYVLNQTKSGCPDSA
ncbi:MAG: hypothetical protein KGH63_00580 [Candidatus Micrarchaeota archaeon]|nr:hypothetical protein [Candidatus Micrarchaeota archaeon]